MKVMVAGYALCILLPPVCLAQAPVGTIAGMVRDPSGAVIKGAHVQAVSRASSQARRTVTAEPGDFSFPALLVGEYDVSAERAPAAVEWSADSYRPPAGDGLDERQRR